MHPDFQLIADDVDVTEVLRDRLLSLTVRDESGSESDTIEIQLDDRDNRIVWPSEGASLQVSLGYRVSGLISMGQYTVDEVSVSGPPDTLTIRGKAADMRASLKAPQTQSWHEVSLGDIVNSIAQRHGLMGRVAGHYAGIHIPHIDQLNESDLHFLTRLAKQYDAVSKPVSGFWVFVPKGQARSATGQLIPLVTIERHQIVRYRFTQSERSRYQSVRAFWYRTEQGEKADVVIGQGKPVSTIRHAYPTQQEAFEAAQARLQLLSRGTAQLSLTLIGLPALQAEGRLLVRDLRPPLAGQWQVQSLEHQLNAQGLATRCEATVPAL